MLFRSLLIDMKALRINLDYDDSGALLANFVVRPSLVDQIRVSQMQDEKLVAEVQKILNEGVNENFSITEDGMLTLRAGHVCWM